MIMFDKIELLYRKKKYSIMSMQLIMKEKCEKQLERSMKYAKMIYKIIDNVDKVEMVGVQFLHSGYNLNFTKSMDYLQSVYNYLDGKDGLDDKFQKKKLRNRYLYLRRIKMANIKLKDLLKEMTIAGGVVSDNPWLK